MRNIEPTFLGLPCTGKDEDRIKRLQEEINARNLMMSFYKLDREEQLILAAACTQLVMNKQMEKNND